MGLWREGGARWVCAKWVWVGANTLLTLAFLTVSSSAPSWGFFVFVHRHHSPSLMRQETWVGLGGFLCFSSFCLQEDLRIWSEVPLETQALKYPFWSSSFTNRQNFIWKSKTMLKVNLVLLTKNKHLELPVLKSTENCKLPQLLLAKLYRARCIKTLVGTAESQSPPFYCTT